MLCSGAHESCEGKALLVVTAGHINPSQPLGQWLEQLGTCLLCSPWCDTWWRSTIWKRKRAARQENSLRATEVLSSQSISTWNHHDTNTVHRPAEEQIPAQTLHLCCVHAGQAKQEQTLLLQLSSCLTCTSRPLYCLLCHSTATKLPSVEGTVICKVLAKTNYGKQLICTGHSNLTAMLEQPGCSTLPLHYSPPICCSIRSSWRKGKWDSVHESTNESDFSFTYENILKRRKLH